MSTRLRSLLLIFMLLTVPPSHGAAMTEYDAKTAFLYNFALLTTWPGPLQQIRVCYVGRSRFSGALEQLTRETIRDWPIMLSYPVREEDYARCNLIFFAASGHDGFDAGYFRDRPILTVTDDPDLFAQGAMIGMFLRDGRLAFDVRLDLVKRANLGMSSKLLKIAHKVYAE